MFIIIFLDKWICVLSKEGIIMGLIFNEMSIRSESTQKVVFVDNGLIVDTETPEQLCNNTNNQRKKQF